MTFRSTYAAHASPPGLKAELLKYVRLILTKGSGAGAALLLNILLARLLVPELAGLLFFCIALGTFASLVSRQGLDIACLKNIASLPERDQSSYLCRALMLSLLANVPTILLGLLVVHISSATQANVGAAAVLFAAATLSMSLISIASETLKARHRTGEGLFWQTVCQPILTLLLIAVLGRDLESVVTGMVISHSLVALGSILRAWSSLAPGSATVRSGWRELLLLGLPLMLIALMNSLIELSDTLLLGLLRSAAEVSIYYVAAKIAALSTMLLFIINGTIGPDISRRWTQHDHQGAFAIVRKYSRFMFLLALAILITIALLRGHILAVFGEEYREQGAFALLVLACGYFFVLAAGPLGIFMTMTGHHRPYLYNNIGACLLALALNLLLIPPYGINGACFATALALATKNALLYLQYKKIVRSTSS